MTHTHACLHLFFFKKEDFFVGKQVPAMFDSEESDIESDDPEV